MKATCLSDLHGHLPNINPTDLLLIAGDICPTCDHSVSFQGTWLNGNFIPWVKNLISTGKARYVVCVAGNHDFYFEKYPQSEYSVFSNVKHPMLTDKNFYYLQDNFVCIEGLKIWGSPWQRYFGGWAFNAHEHELAVKYNQIPDDTDIIISHGPPYGFGDVSLQIEDEEKYPKIVHLGSPSLTQTIKRVQPRLVLVGHIHPGYGKFFYNETIIVNGSYVDNQYKPRNPIIEVEL